MNTPDKIANIMVVTIPHDNQRYDTVGDYWFGAGDTLDMRVSDMGDWRFGIACAVHELVEAALLVTNKIDEAQVSEFDEDYEKARQYYLECQRLIALGHVIAESSISSEALYRKKWACPCEIDNSTEPGEDIHAPYYAQHMVADNIERIVLRELGGVWKDYQAKVESMVWRGSDKFNENGEASEDADG